MQHSGEGWDNGRSITLYGPIGTETGRLPRIRAGAPLNWAKRDPWIDKYIDDANVGQHHHVGQAPGLISVNKEKSCLRATDCEEVFQIIKRNAARVGMRVTDAKTQLVCISTNSALDVHSFANVGGLQITSQLSLKILGFMIGGDLGMGDHVGLISRKFYA